VRDGGELLRRIADVLDAFCSSFVELRSGLDQFGSDVAVRTFRDRTRLHHAEAGRDVLHYLLSGEAAGSSRVRDLKSAFADVMIHQIAMISGVMDGVRGLLKRFSPEAVEADLSLRPVKIGLFRVKRGLWPFSLVARWRRFAHLHEQFMEDDQGISAVLFGKEFARSYGAAHGEHAGSGRKVRRPGYADAG
jgi:type VI secretion system protein